MSDLGPMREPPQSEERTPLLTGWMIVVIIGIAAVTVVGLAALVTRGSTTSVPSSTPTTSVHPNSTTSTTSTHPSTTTTAAPATTVASTTTAPPVVPMALVCEGTPMYEPSSLHWCTSLCSSYVDNISWTSWTPQSASGTGTLMTNSGIPNCSQGTWTAQPGFQVALSNPSTVAYCSGPGSPATGFLFTATNIWNFPLPDITPPCP